MMNRNRARRPGQRNGAVERKMGEIRLGERAGPVSLGIVVLEDRALVAAGQDLERSLFRSDVLEQYQKLASSQMGMGIEDDVLMPLDLGAAAGPFEVRHDLPETDVGAKQVGRDHQLAATDAHWVAGRPAAPFRGEVRIRYRHRGGRAEVTPNGSVVTVSGLPKSRSSVEKISMSPEGVLSGNLTGSARKSVNATAGSVTGARRSSGTKGRSGSPR